LKPLAELAGLVEKDDEGKWDREVPFQQIRCNSDGTLYSLKRKTKGAAPTPLALSQLADLVIPHKGGNFVVHAPFDLRARCLNYYLAKKNGSCLLRGKDRTIRGILADYTAYDNRHLLQAASLALGDIEYELKSYFLGDESFWISITVPRLGAPDLGGLTGGIRLGNSEVGLRSVCCYALVWRQVCSNGLMGWTERAIFRKVHRGRFSIEELTEKLQVAIAEALERADDTIDKLRASASEKVLDLAAVIDRIVERRHLTEEFREAIIGAMYVEPQYTGSLFGLVNAMTRASQIYAGDRRVQMEREAGRLLNWQEDPEYSEIVLRG